MWQYRLSVRGLPQRLLSSLRALLHTPFTLWAELALVLVITLILLTRFWAARDLEAPMWGDSYQHTMIAQLIVDNDGLFNSWQPYAEMTTFTYHFGFHSQVAVFHWITGLPMHQATLWMGQILNAMAVIFLFPLAMRLKRSTWGGVITLLIAGLLVPMPMFYINWGRYTQLAGQAILPALICLVWAALESEKRSWRAIIPAWIALAGLALTHYRVVIFAVLFFVAHFLINLRPKTVIRQFVTIAVITLGALALVLPWYVHIFSGTLPDTIQKILGSTATSIATATPITDPISDPTQYLPMVIWLILPLVIGWRLWSRDRAIALFSLWCYLIYLAVNPNLIELPGARLIGNFTIFIAAYFPASLILGSSAGYWIDSHFNPDDRAFKENYRGTHDLAGWALSALFLLVGVSALWGARARLWDVEPMTHAMVTRPDMRAYDWIQENTSPDATFLINSFPIYNNHSAVGADGGWWLPLLAHRQNSVPPKVYEAEQGPDPGFRERVVSPTLEIANKGITNPDVLALLQDHQITHVFIGQQQGSINNTATLDPFMLSSSPYYAPIYHQDRVWIFEILYP
jgi:hypothetical protein